MWRVHDVITHGEGTKYIAHPEIGAITMEYSAFAVDGKPHLSMVVYNPASAGQRNVSQATQATSKAGAV